MHKRPKQQSNYGLAIAFAASVLAIGIPYWITPYHKLSLPDSLLEYAVMPVALVAILTPFLCRASVARIALVLGTAAPVAVFLRVVVEVAYAPTTHNLWPIEIVIALVIGMVTAWPCAAIGGLLRHAGLPTKEHLQ